MVFFSYLFSAFQTLLNLSKDCLAFPGDAGRAAPGIELPISTIGRSFTLFSLQHHVTGKCHGMFP